jgi:hypothetical protein
MKNQGIFASFKSRTFRSSARKPREGSSLQTYPLSHATSQKEASPCSFLLPGSPRRRNLTRQHREEKKPLPEKKNNRIKHVPQEARNIARKEGDSGEGTNKRPRRNGVDAELAQGLRRHQGHHHRQPRQPQLRLQGAPRSSVFPLPISPDFSST